MAIVAIVGLFVEGWSGDALAASPTKEQVCEARKLEAAGAKANCLLRAYAAQVQGKTANFDTCMTKFTTAFDKAEKPGECLTEGDTAAVEAQVDAAAANLAAALSGATPPATHQFPATGQTTCWSSDVSGTVIPCAGTGQDGDIRAGAVLSYTDNGDGTITDNNTGLMWEKKDNNDTDPLHDVDTIYTWANAFAVHIAGLNAGPGFAGYTDWRLPNYKELTSILNLETFNPAVSPAFNTDCAAGCTVTTCSCTPAASFWSSSAVASTPDSAWRVSFFDGFVVMILKDFSLRVRAVRGGF
jgi:hypothetical protein